MKREEARKVVELHANGRSLSLLSPEVASSPLKMNGIMSLCRCERGLKRALNTPTRDCPVTSRAYEEGDESLQ